MRKWMIWVICVTLLMGLPILPAYAEDDAAGLAYDVSVETFNDKGEAAVDFAVGETVVAKVMLRSTGSQTAPIYAYQGILRYGLGLTYLDHTAEGTVGHRVQAREVAFALAELTGITPDDPYPMLTVRFTATADGKPVFRLSDVIVANYDATKRSVTVEETAQITVGTGVQLPTPEALTDNIAFAELLLSHAIVSDTEIESYYPSFRVTQQVYQQLAQQIEYAKSVLYAEPASSEEEIQVAMDALQAAVEVFETNRIYRYEQDRPTSSGGGRAQEIIVKLSFGEGGTASFASGNISKVKKGTSLTVQAVPDEGYEVLSIYINGERLPGQQSYTIPSVDFATEIYVEFCKAMPFRDVVKDAWYCDSVRYAWAKGLLKGVEENLFGPDITTTRGMIVTILHRLEGEPVAVGSVFADVSGDAYYAVPVAWASENGIVMGYGDGAFGPDDPITREQMAAILYRYAKMKEYSLSASADLSVYTDADRISSYAVEAIGWANTKGIISGKGNGILDPGGSALRSEVAAILLRFIENVQ